MNTPVCVGGSTAFFPAGCWVGGGLLLHPQPVSLSGIAGVGGGGVVQHFMRSHCQGGIPGVVVYKLIPVSSQQLDD